MRARRRTGAGVFGSRSIPRSAPCRASTRPHLRSRQTWTIGFVMMRAGRSGDGFQPRASHFPAAVDGDQAAEDRLGLDPGEAGPAGHVAELVHRREAADRFDEVAIAFLVLGDGLADPRDDVYRIALVEAGEARPA